MRAVTMDYLNVYEICLECKNFFCGSDDIFSNTFTIENGQISDIDFLADNQWFRIKGSKFNDGVYENKAEALAELVPETFSGSIWAMTPSKAFLADCKDVEDWKAKYNSVDSVAMSPYQSESFAGYSYSKGSQSGADGYNSTDYMSVFADRLRKWRRLNTV